MKMIVMGSICLSIFASILFYAQHLGISVVLFVTATLLALFYFLEQRKKIKNRKAYFLAIPILLLASTYFIYNQTFFKVTNMIAILSLTAMMLIWALSEKGETKYLVKRIFTCIFAPLEHVSEAMKGITKTLFAKKQREKKEEKAYQANLDRNCYFTSFIVNCIDFAIFC